MTMIIKKKKYTLSSIWNLCGIVAPMRRRGTLYRDTRTVGRAQVTKERLLRLLEEHLERATPAERAKMTASAHATVAKFRRGRAQRRVRRATSPKRSTR